MPALKRRRGDPRQERHGARGRDAVLALAAHERVDVRLFGFQIDAEPGGRAESEGGVPSRPDRPFFRSEPELRPANCRPGEIDGHRSGDAPWRRPILAGRGSGQSGRARQSKPHEPAGRVAFQHAFELAGRPARPGVHLDAERRPFRPRLLRSEPEDDRRAVGAGKLAGKVGRPVEGRNGGVDVDAGDLRRGSVGAAGDPHPPVAHDQTVDPGRLEPSDRQRRQPRRAIGAAHDRQNRFVEADVREPDLAARELDERELEPRGIERQLGTIGAWRGQRAGAKSKIGRRQESDLDRSGQRDVRAGDRAQPRLDLGAVRGPIDKHGRDERCRHHGDERDRDDGQDIAHGERTTTPPRRAAAGTTRRPSRFKMARKYDHDNRRRSPARAPLIAAAPC